MREALLAVLGALALTLPSSIQEAAGAPIATKHCPRECTKFVTKRIPQYLLKSYEKSTCGKAAVVLTTKKNKIFCADPNVDWVQLTMRTLDENKSVSEKQLMSRNVSGVATPTSAQPGGPAHHQTTFFPIMRTGVSSTSTGSSAGPILRRDATHQPETLVNGSMFSSVADGPNAISTTISPDLQTLSNLLDSILSSPSTGPGPNSEEGSTVIPQRKRFTGQSRTPFSSDGKKPSPVNIPDRWGVVNHSAVASGDISETPSTTEANSSFYHKSLATLPTSHQESELEKSRAGELTSHMPDVPVNSLPNLLSTYRTHFIILASLAGLLCILGTAWAFAKLRIFTTSPSSEMVRGLFFSPSKYQTSDIL